MKVKGQQWSSRLDYAPWLLNLVRRIAVASLGWWWPSRRSKANRGQNNKQCSMATELGQKNRWCKFRMMIMTFTEVKGQKMSNDKQFSMATKLGQKNRWHKFVIMMTFTEVKGQQRSNIVSNDPWLSNLVRKSTDASLGWWWWPSWRSKVNGSQIL